MRVKPDHLCYNCEKLNEDQICGPYGIIGMNYRNRMGMCPVVNRYAVWRADAPVTKEKKKVNPLKANKRK